MIFSPPVEEQGQDLPFFAQPAGIRMFAPRLHFTYFSKFPAFPLGLLLILVVCLTGGCRPPEPIHSYTPPDLERNSYELDRMLVAIVPIGDSAWFFKLQGQDEPVYNQKEVFAKFLNTVRAPQTEPGEKSKSEPTWMTPAEWKSQRPGNEMIFRSYRIPNGNERPLKLEISMLPIPEAGVDDAFLLQNINRWCRQYGNDSITEKDVGQYSEKVELKDLMPSGGEAWIVNMSGIFSGRSGMAAPMQESDPHADVDDVQQHPATGGRGSPVEDPHAGVKLDKDSNHPPTQTPAAQSSRVKVNVPPDWKPGKASSFIRREVSLTDADNIADISLMALPADANDLATNLARWRGQVELPEVSSAEMLKGTQKITVDGASGDLVELVGTSKTILAAMVKKGNEAWFFKLIAPNATAAKEKAKFEEFVKTTKLP
ncbi:MAG: hypothetical protein JWM11_5376 [Planctomycetaceae bacterium]|nr:hypothetical protein [Planctomycetaceae bacterium]